MAEPGYKVTIQQDFFTLDGEKQIPKCRQKSIEMYKPKYWDDVTRIYSASIIPGRVLSVKVSLDFGAFPIQFDEIDDPFY